MEQKETEGEGVDPPTKMESTTVDATEEKEEAEHITPRINMNKKRKLLPADSFARSNVIEHQRLISGYDNNYNNKYGDANNMRRVDSHMVSPYEQKRQKYKVLQRRRRYVVQELNLPKKINYWSVEDVADWIGYVGFSNYQETMFDNNINGEVLVSLTKDDLRDMSIRAIGDRILILNAIETLKRSSHISTTNAKKSNVDGDNGNAKQNMQYLEYLKEQKARENQGKMYVYQQQQEIPLSRHNVPDLNFTKVIDHRGNNDVTSDSARSSASSA